MKLVFDIFMSLVFCFWPMLMMFSPMMFDAPGSEKNVKMITIMCLIMMYPIVIAAAFFAFDIHYLDFSPSTLLLYCTVIVLGGFTLFGYPKMIWNLIRGIPASGYAVVRQQVYFSGNKISMADAPSFQLLSLNVADEQRPCRYAADKRHCYYLGKVVQGFQPDNAYVTLIDAREYLVNDSQIADAGKLLEGANPKTYHVYQPYSSWAYSANGDDDTVYYLHQPLPNIDYASFTPLTHAFGKDHNALFHRQQRVALEVDLASFKLLDDDCYFADKNHFYYLSDTGLARLDNEHIDDIALLGHRYIKGKHAIYHYRFDHLTVVKQADVASFEVTDYDAQHQSHARDKHHYFMRGEVVG
ncbi:DKNYY domain-containing protein [Shewanella sp. C32]|uniref:DKNYY domain-containing protein n=1 Tax=Shewanella electrica TaxID=515560 RepID=A0ABT2FGL6_9GAMM|nr:DKNYY domain-containing protein [Shewanella electrica]MCH1923366.1 DKNYY domain-containing protein [Shewanella electrica]MCS4555463.1 DKNYY domain-containing protein [Shewanella electrica]